MSSPCYCDFVQLWTGVPFQGSLLGAEDNKELEIKGNQRANNKRKPKGNQRTREAWTPVYCRLGSPHLPRSWLSVTLCCLCIPNLSAQGPQHVLCNPNCGLTRPNRVATLAPWVSAAPAQSSPLGSSRSKPTLHLTSPTVSQGLYVVQKHGPKQRPSWQRSQLGIFTPGFDSGSLGPQPNWSSGSNQVAFLKMTLYWFKGKQHQSTLPPTIRQDIGVPQKENSFPNPLTVSFFNCWRAGNFESPSWLCQFPLTGPEKQKASTFWRHD